MSHFRDKVVVTHLFPILHDPNNARLVVSSTSNSREITYLDLMPPLFVDLLLRLLPLFTSLNFTRHLGDLEFRQRSSKRFVECENIVQADISTFRRLCQDSILATC
jgi:hypothetical protein